MPSKEHEALVEQIGQLVYKAQRHRSNPNHAASEIISTILAAQNEHIEAKIDGYIENFRTMSRINGVHVTRARTELKRRLIDESPLGEQSE
ncbi:hypothetical protein F9L00_12745 [Brucella anthropi]|uniref:hypothetical protein n=1 Tax=Brucella/Ochrobactrum group TaxID=2826938 RepID=UPI00124C722D|nr:MULTISPECIES: hypothetical protein [Brucella/Ochrobactrum group]KAB2761719.1 hypothetical protein F9K98_15485 [Brucella anthropi]KAB2777590.1 hypothetical protein F9L00_12745 [Brucella anthropi]MCQ9145134.1 hypothetical protein [Ochrobactrum sp. BTU2]UGQ23259.1 hypothetical protein LRL11_22465 [Brucella anthropi]